jgi:ABC-type enterochelin transport system substrate-binding protein
MKETKQVLLFVLLAGVMVFTACSSNSNISPATEEGKIMQWSSPPPMSIDQSKEYKATIKTSFGDIVVQLFPKDAPIAVNNFVFLARHGFCDRVKFHRVVKGFVI